jgi:hypothetical protein
MQQNVIEANRERHLYLRNLEDGKPDGNVVFIPQGWCDCWLLSNGMAGGIDWTPDHPQADLADGPEIYCYAPTQLQANSEVETLFVLVEWLQVMEEIEESTARRLHPALFEYLDKINRGVV